MQASGAFDSGIPICILNDMILIIFDILQYIIHIESSVTILLNRFNNYFIIDKK